MIFGLSVVTILLAAVYSIAQMAKSASADIYGKCLNNKYNKADAVRGTLGWHSLFRFYIYYNIAIK